MNIIDAINTSGITSEGSIRPANLLDACCRWTGCQGGTIHEYLPRLHWNRAGGPCVRGMGPVPVWHLELDGYSIGWTQCRKSELPAIQPDLSPNILDYIPTQVRKL